MNIITKEEYEFISVIDRMCTKLGRYWCSDDKLETIGSDLCKALKEGNKFDSELPQYTKVEVELANLLIRILGFAGKYGLRIGGATIMKLKGSL